MFKGINFMFMCVDDLSGENVVPPSKKLEDLIHLADLCVDLLQQNEEHYAEVSVSKILLTFGFYVIIIYRLNNSG